MSRFEVIEYSVVIRTIVTMMVCSALPAVSLCGALVALVLVVSETYRCLRYTVQQEMVVDMSRESSLHIDFNITFPALPCRTLRMTLGDSSGNFETESIMEQVQCVDACLFVCLFVFGMWTFLIMVFTSFMFIHRLIGYILMRSTILTWIWINDSCKHVFAVMERFTNGSLMTTVRGCFVKSLSDLEGSTVLSY